MFRRDGTSMGILACLMHLCIRVNKNPLNVVYWELRDGHLTSEYSLSLGIVSLYSRFRY